LTFTAERESAANNTPQAIALQKHQNEGGEGEEEEEEGEEE
jgi:hypothetical protein